MPKPTIPRIPSRFLAYLPDEEQAKLKSKGAMVTKEHNHTSDISVGEFLNRKLQTLQFHFSYFDDYKLALERSSRTLPVDNKVFNEELRDLHTAKLECEDEMLTLKRQKRIIAGDLEDRPPYETLEFAYATAMKTKVMRASGKQKKSRSRQTEFKKSVTAYLKATKVDDLGNELLWCHLSSEWHREGVKAAHIVPKCLDSDELAYLFGVGNLALTDQRNGITLSSIIEKGLDAGIFVIVPAAKGDKLRWKCILVDQNAKNDTFINWKALDGRELQFQTEHARPAARYFYFRYVITCLHHISLGQQDWLLDLGTAAMWATPGPYLRESMLHIMGKQVGDVYLPEVFYNSTFTESDCRAAVDPEEERSLATSLKLRLDWKRREDEAEGDDSDEELVYRDHL